MLLSLGIGQRNRCFGPDPRVCVLAERADQGFLWWDFVHPTSFGHEMIADVVFPEVEKRVEAIAETATVRPPPI